MDGAIGNSGVYQLRSTVTGERYIGSTTNLRTRRNAHASGLRRGNHRIARLRELVEEHGADTIVFEVLEKCSPSETLACECRWIRATAPELNARRGDKIGGCRPRGGKRKTFVATLPKGMPDELTEAAAEKGWDRSRLIEELAAAYLKRREREGKDSPKK